MTHAQAEEADAGAPQQRHRKDYTGWKLVIAAPCGTGVQVSLVDVLGFMLAGKEGLELNLLGFVIGAGLSGLSLPGAGRVPGKADWTGQHADVRIPTPLAE